MAVTMVTATHPMTPPTTIPATATTVGCQVDVDPADAPPSTPVSVMMSGRSFSFVGEDVVGCAGTAVVSCTGTDCAVVVAVAVSVVVASSAVVVVGRAVVVVAGGNEGALECAAAQTAA